LIETVGAVAGGLASLALGRWGYRRLQLSLAKHRSLRGHAKWSQRLARLLPDYEFHESEFFGTDGAPAEIQERRRSGFERLVGRFREKAPRTLALSGEIEGRISDVQFVNRYRVPFPFRHHVRQHLKLGCVAAATKDRRICDLDGNWSLDLTGAYGVNVFGFEVYKGCIERAAERARELGPVLGLYHPVIAENARRLLSLSGHDECSFHMSGTEAVMQAVRLARYHTRRSHIVRFCGAYHGWWDGVQAGPGNPRPPHEVYTLADMSEASLRVLRTRKDIACVLVNPLQALHPNGNAPSDGALVTGTRSMRYDKAAYTAWLRKLRDVCTERGIVLIFDEVFLGFRLAPGGAQEYFGVRADLVTYGKTLGGGLPIGAVCGRADLMRRFREDRPSDVCFARGTFNSHPYVMTAMAELLDHLERRETRAAYQGIDERWDDRAKALNDALAARGLPIRVANMTSIWTTLFTQPSRYAWMFQYYLRDAGVAMSWVGSGRFIFSHDFTDADMAELREKLVAAAEAMRDDGFWWSSPSLTGKSIGRRVLKEMLAARLGLRRRPKAEPEAERGEEAETREPALTISE
jgi:glutamate-1-semialdehyde 2,1-aminomutase